MKKRILPLCLLLLATTFYGCSTESRPNGSSAVPSSASSGESSLSGTDSSSGTSSEKEKMPTTKSEIIAHNDKLTDADVQLIQFDSAAADTQTVQMKTSQGDITLVLYPKEAPKVVENFLALVSEGFYNNKPFYMVKPGERIFAGASDAYGYEGKSSSRELVEDEFSSKLWHFTGALCTNNNMLKNANDSRFYIVQADPITEEMAGQLADVAFPQKVINKYLEVGGLPAADFRDTVFGQVIEGMDVVKAIAGSSADKQPVTILSITIKET